MLFLRHNTPGKAMLWIEFYEHQLVVSTISKISKALLTSYAL